MREPLRVLDIFSGIGGFSLGLERAGMTTVAFCEIEEFPRRVLAKHWPHVPIFHDVRTLSGADVGAVDVICGGYPCQPFSLAGKRGGAEDDRHLWPEMRRLVDELRPAWVIGENVAGHISMGLDDVLSDLESLGYAARAFVIPAVAVGAPHRRDRLWIVANATWVQPGRQEQRAFGERVGAGGEPLSVADTNGKRGRGGHTERQDAADAWQSSRRADARWWEFEPDVGRVAHGVPAELDGGLNEKELDQEEGAGVGPGSRGMRGVRRNGETCSPSSELRRARSLRGPMSALPHQGGPAGRAQARQTAEGLQGVREDVHADAQQETHDLQPGVPFGYWPHERGEALGIWAKEPEVPRVAHGVKSRVQRLRGLGNAVVPQIVEVIGKAIIQAKTGQA